MRTKGRWAVTAAATLLAIVVVAAGLAVKEPILQCWYRWKLEPVALRSVPWELIYHYRVPSEGTWTLTDSNGRGFEDSAWIEMNSDGRVRYAQQPAFADSNFSHKDFLVSREQATSMMVQLLSHVPDLRDRYEPYQPGSAPEQRPLLTGKIAGDEVQFRVDPELWRRLWPIFEKLEDKAATLPWTYDMRAANQ